jgi:hypothetical protein
MDRVDLLARQKDRFVFQTGDSLLGQPAEQSTVKSAGFPMGLIEFRGISR